MQQPAHIAILGAGLAGLSAAYDLARAGYRVTVLEAAPYVGGLASSFSIEGLPVEKYYHFICRADHALLQLIQELGLSLKLHWKQTHTSFFYHGKHYPFGTPFDLFFFSPIPLLQRARFGLHIIRSRYRSQWRWLDQLAAKPWLIENIGEEAYQVIWHPLLRIKFGGHYDKISAAWVWHRIWRVAKSRRYLWEHESFGYLEHGSATVVDQLESWLGARQEVNLRTSTKVKSVEIQNGKVTGVLTGLEFIPCDAVISTLALPVLNQLIPQAPVGFSHQLAQVQYIGVVCALLSLNRPFSRSFWMNINDPEIIFNGVIEQTNLNQNLRRAGLNLLYIPLYIPTSESYYHVNEEALFNEYLPMLKRVNPAFDETWIKERHVFRTPYAQAICTTGFAEQRPNIKTPITGLYLTDSTQFYPEDRTISAAIRQGRLAAQAVREDLHAFRVDHV